MERQLTLTDLTSIQRLSVLYGECGNDYIYSRFSPIPDQSLIFDKPTRIMGLAVCLFRKGKIHGEVDFQPITIHPNSLMVLGWSTVVKFNSPAPGEPRIETDALFISPAFIQDLNLDLNSVDLHSFVDEKPSRVISNLSETDMERLSSIMRLFYLNTVEGNASVFTKHIARSLTQTLIYQMLQMRDSRVPVRMADSADASQSRQKAYVQEFMRLLQLHHSRQRSINFYAEKLFISPKYLSHLIKEATGKSATEWIGTFVVQEAKNLLRYSNKNVQQIAYDLNFSTQSSFGKYFKHITGMSPTDFQKGG